MKEERARKYPRMEKLTHRRQVMNLTREELGELSGVSKYVIAEYENGGRVPKTDVMAKLAVVLKCTVDDLIEPAEASVV